jgi:hypothetical protein
MGLTVVLPGWGSGESGELILLFESTAQRQRCHDCHCLMSDREIPVAGGAVARAGFTMRFLALKM